MKQLVSVVTLAILVATPAMAATCAAMCLPGQGGRAHEHHPAVALAGGGSQSDHDSAHGAAMSVPAGVSEAAPPGHRHHHEAATPRPRGPQAAATHAAGLQLQASDRGCCPVVDGAPVGSRALRAAPVAGIGAPPAVHDTVFPSRELVRHVPAYGPTGLAPSPARLVRVLRI